MSPSHAPSRSCRAGVRPTRPSVRTALVAALALVVSACAPGQDEAADLVLTGGKVVTVDAAIPEAEAVAVRDGRIAAVGSSAEIASWIGPETQVVELEGRVALPGFIEGHAHYMRLGSAQLELDLTEATSWDEIVTLVAGAVAEAEPGELIRGRGWHQEKWTERPEPNVDGLPHHDALSAVSPDNPVILVHASGHASFANAHAMRLAGIDGSTPDPDGGEILRDPHGAPIGAFRETAAGLLAPAREGTPDPDPRRVALLAQEEAFRNGITSFQDAGSGFGTIDLWKSMVDDGSLKIRLYGMIRADNQELARRMPEARVVGYGDDRLTVRSLKVSIDGALGSHGAWLLEPYDDLPTSTGLNTAPPEEIREKARLALEHDWQLNVHAIGDRGNRETLDIFEEAYARAGGEDLRWRVEHAQHLHPDDIPRFGALGVIASMQGVHATSDGPWVEPKLGAERTEEGAYVWRDLWDSGAVVMNGTDAPVEDVSPIASYYATFSRRMANGERFTPAQRLTRMEALETYTINAAYGAFEEGIKGSLTPGKLGDIVVLSDDILTVDESRIPDVTVEMTIVGGELVYERGTEGS
jgi:predicted amidohydrolase YtcJ